MNNSNNPFQNSSKFPNVFPIALSHSQFPSKLASYDHLGMPIGCIISPFIATESGQELSEEFRRLIESGTRIARCTLCSAYINPHCECSQLRWFCSVCGSRNSFTRSMVRYRQVELRLLPEISDLVVDYPMPFGNVAADCFSIPSALRPLVQVFLVQESMCVDTMQAVIESLTATIAQLHPDIHIVLLTYSYRIGIYRFCASSSLPTVQYIHMATEDGYGELLEGRDVFDFSGNCKVNLVQSLSTFDFYQSACRIGDCREVVLAAVSSLFDAFTGGADELSNSTSYSSNSVVPNNILGPVLEDVISWLVDPIGQQAGSSYDSSNNELLQVDTPTVISNESTHGGFGVDGLLEALREVSFSLLGGETTNNNDNGTNVAGNNNMNADNNPQDDGTNNASYEYNKYPTTVVGGCSGVVLHIFTSNPQDLPINAHLSCNKSHPSNKNNRIPTSRESSPYKNSSNSNIGLDKTWIEELAVKCADKALLVNVWLLSSFSGRHTDAAALIPLAMRTGGILQKCVLSNCPRDERARFAEVVCRAVNQQWASKCILKLRLPKVLSVIPNEISGPVTADEVLEGVLRMPGCNNNTSLGFQFAFKEPSTIPSTSGTANTSLHEEGDSLVLQMAFSYETLVEEQLHGADDDSVDNNSDLRRYENIDEESTITEKYSASMKHLLRQDNTGDYEASQQNYFDCVLDIMQIKDEVPLRNQLVKEKLTNRNKKVSLKSPKKKIRSVTSRPNMNFPTNDDESNLPEYKLGLSCACPYDHSKKLVAVRRLRVITIMVECSAKIPRLLQSTHPPVLAQLIARQAWLHDYHSAIYPAILPTSSTNPRDLPITVLTPIKKHWNPSQAVDALGNEDVLGDLTEGSNLIHHWAISIVVAAATLVRASMNPEKLKQHTPDTIIRETMKHSVIKNILRLLFGVLHLQACSLQSLVSGDGGDDAMELLNMLCTVDSQTARKLFYPELVPLDDKLVLQSQYIENPLALKREAMMMTTITDESSNATLSPAAYLVDAGRELILYRPMQNVGKMNGITSPPRSNNSTSSIMNGTIPNNNNANNNVTNSNNTASLHTPSVLASASSTSSLTESKRSSALVNNTAVATVSSVSSLNLLPRPPPPPLAPPSLHERLMKPPTSLLNNRNSILVSNADTTAANPAEEAKRQEAVVIDDANGAESAVSSVTVTPRSPDDDHHLPPPTHTQQQLSDELTAADPPKRDSKELEHLLYVTWIGNDLERRLSLSGLVVPRVVISEAGTVTAGYLTHQLIEDSSKIRNGASFDQFVSLISRRALVAFDSSL